MSRVVPFPAPVSPELAAAWLFEDGEGLLTIATDPLLAAALLRSFVARGQRAGTAPNDFDEVRAAFRRHAYEAERIGRFALCARYKPAYIKERMH